MNLVFFAGGAACTLSLWCHHAAGALNLTGVWVSIMSYYVALAAATTVRWMALHRRRSRSSSRSRSGVMAAPATSST